MTSPTAPASAPSARCAHGLPSPLGWPPVRGSGASVGYPSGRLGPHVRGFAERRSWESSANRFAVAKPGGDLTLGSTLLERVADRFHHSLQGKAVEHLHHPPSVRHGNAARVGLFAVGVEEPIQPLSTKAVAEASEVIQRRAD